MSGFVFRRECREILKCLKRHLSSNPSKNTVDLSYYEYGQAKTDKNTLIMVHGLFGHNQNFHSLSKKFSLNRKVIAVCNRNHGDSPQSPVMNYQVMADDLEDLLDKLKLDKVILLGHSMGGKIVMASALKHPERVTGLIVVDVAPSTSFSWNLEDYLKKMKEIKFRPGVSLSQSRKYADKELEPVVPEVEVRRFLLTNVVDIDGTIKWRFNLDAIASNTNHLREFPLFDGKTFEKPSIFIGGSNSPQIRAETIVEIKQYFPPFELEMVKGAGHWVHSAKPEEFFQIVDTFLTRQNL